MENITLTCLASVVDATYSWHRVGGIVPLGSIGQNSNNLTMLRVVPLDSGAYYCIAKKDQVIVESDKVSIRVIGEKLYWLLYILHE